MPPGRHLDAGGTCAVLPAFGPRGRRCTAFFLLPAYLAQSKACIFKCTLITETGKLNDLVCTTGLHDTAGVRRVLADLFTAEWRKRVRHSMRSTLIYV